MERIRPTKVRIEASSACQLRCPICVTATGKIRDGAVRTGFLEAAHFRNLIDENPHVRTVELSNYGEIFLNPELPSILRHAHEKGVRIEATNGVNLNHAKEEALEAVVRYQMHKLNVSIDGATQETYAIYRVRGNLSTVLANVKKINAYKKQYDSPYPQLYWQFILFGHNEHEVGQAQRMAEELGMTFFPKLNTTQAYSPVEDAQRVKELTRLPVVSREEYNARFHHSYPKMCYQLWLEPQINWDGRVLGCCVNYWGEFGGNAFEDGLDTVLNSPGLRHARKLVSGKALPTRNLPCTRCQIYWRMLRHWDWMKIEDVTSVITEIDDYLPDGGLYARARK
ncbi:MAG: radical SAM protein [Planctomycetota bacterium]